MTRARIGVWLFAALWLALSGSSAARNFLDSPDRSFAAMVDWGVIGASLIAPLVGIWRLFTEPEGDERTLVNTSLRLVVMTYLPLWTAMRIVERMLSPH